MKTMSYCRNTKLLVVSLFILHTYVNTVILLFYLCSVNQILKIMFAHTVKTVLSRLNFN